MKMKAVCEVTGLTGWNVRNYIRGKLIDPAYTETYLGRKHYDFSERDISRLRQIVILRKGGFSVERIEEMFRDPGAVRKNVEELREGGMLNGDSLWIRSRSWQTACGLSLRKFRFPRKTVSGIWQRSLAEALKPLPPFS